MSDYAENEEITTIRESIAAFLLSCKVEGKSYGTIKCYTEKLKGFQRKIYIVSSALYFQSLVITLFNHIPF